MYESEHVLFLDASDNEDLDQMIMKDQNMNYWIQDQADTETDVKANPLVYAHLLCLFLRTWIKVTKASLALVTRATEQDFMAKTWFKDHVMARVLKTWIQVAKATRAKTRAKATRVKTQVLKTWFQVAKMTRVSRAMKALEDAQAMVDAQAQEETRIEAIVRVNLRYAIDAVIAQGQGQIDPTKDHMAQTALSNVKSAMADLAHVRSLLVEAQTNVQLVMANAH